MEVRDRWWETSLQCCSILAAVGSLATLEYVAGEHAGWASWRSLLIPLALDAYVVRTLTSHRAKRPDQVFALGVLVVAVALSVFSPPARWQSLGLGLVIVATLWRMDAQWRARRVEGDLVAEMGERLRTARQDLATVRRELAEATAATATAVADAVAMDRRHRDREAAEDRRRLAAETGDGIGDAVGERVATLAGDPPPVDGTVPAQVAWVRRLLTYTPDTTWRQVAEHLQLEPRAAQHRITHARKAPTGLHRVGAAS